MVYVCVASLQNTVYMKHTQKIHSLLTKDILLEMGTFWMVLTTSRAV